MSCHRLHFLISIGVFIVRLFSLHSQGICWCTGHMLDTVLHHFSPQIVSWIDHVFRGVPCQKWILLVLRVAIEASPSTC